jgi:hypothetical protein
MKSKFFKFLLPLLLVGIFAYYAFSYIYGREDYLWELDTEYSNNLTMAGDSIADTVDSIRVYKDRRKYFKWYSLEELSKKEVVFETRDFHRIKEIVLAAQERMKGTGFADVPDYFPAGRGCRNAFNKEVESDKFYVVMHDNTLMRAGYFVAAECEYQGREYLEVRVLTDSFSSTFLYNEALFTVLRELGIL